jgi:hypothetical protein
MNENVFYLSFFCKVGLLSLNPGINIKSFTNKQITNEKTFGRFCNWRFRSL